MLVDLILGGIHLVPLWKILVSEVVYLLLKGLRIIDPYWVIQWRFDIFIFTIETAIYKLFIFLIGWIFKRFILGFIFFNLLQGFFHPLQKLLWVNLDCPRKIIVLSCLKIILYIFNDFFCYSFSSLSKRWGIIFFFIVAHSKFFRFNTQIIFVLKILFLLFFRFVRRYKTAKCF